MSEATCKTCPWWDIWGGEDIRGGSCRLAIHHSAPPRGEKEWCSEHPDRKGMSDAELIALAILGTQAAWAEDLAATEIQRRNARRANQEEQS